MLCAVVKLGVKDIEEHNGCKRQSVVDEGDGEESCGDNTRTESETIVLKCWVV